MSVRVPARSRLLRQLRQNLPLAALLLLTFALSVAWSFASPLPNVRGWGNFQPDEAGNIAVIYYMAVHHALPFYDLTYYPTYHPPLYHFLGALVFGLTRPVIGDDPAALLIRVLTGFCGVGTVWLTYRAARHLTGRRTALFAAALVALLPMRVSMGGALNNENLAALGAAGALAAMVGGVTGRGGFTRRRLATLAFWTVVAIGSKVTSLGLLPAAAIALYARSRTDGKSLILPLRQTAIVVGSAIACWGWWFWRNQVVYGDPLVSHLVDRYWDPIQPGYADFARRTGYSPARYALNLTAVAWRSFWGAFDGFSRFLPDGVYAALLAFQAIATGGWFLPTLLPSERRRRQLLALGIAVLTYFLCIALIFYKYNWRHYSPQGRYFFGLLLPFGITTAMGWRRALTRFLPRSVRRGAEWGVAGLLLALNLYLLWVIPQRGH